MNFLAQCVSSVFGRGRKRPLEEDNPPQQGSCSSSTSSPQQPPKKVKTTSTMTMVSRSVGDDGVDSDIGESGVHDQSEVSDSRESGDLEQPPKKVKTTSTMTMVSTSVGDDGADSDIGESGVQDQSEVSDSRESNDLNAPSSSTATSGTLSVLKGELETMQQTVASQIENLGQKFKEVEEVGKQREEENTSLKDLLYRGTKDLHLEKTKSEQLQAKNKELRHILTMTHKNIEKSLVQAAKFLEVTLNEGKVKGNTGGVNTNTTSVTAGVATNQQNHQQEQPKANQTPPVSEPGNSSNIVSANSQNAGKGSITTSITLRPTDKMMNSILQLAKSALPRQNSGNEIPGPSSSSGNSTKQNIEIDERQFMEDTFELIVNSTKGNRKGGSLSSLIAAAAHLEKNERNKSGSSKGVLPEPEVIDESINFSTLRGMDGQIKAVRENVLFPLVNKNVLTECGVDPAKCIVFHGPSGSGKLLMAKAVTTELSRLLGVKFTLFRRHKSEFHKERSHGFIKMFFDAAEAANPCVLYLDDVETVCYYDNFLGQSDALLKSFGAQLDALKSNNIFVIGATTQLCKVDSSLTRRGRFEKAIVFTLPNEERRKTLFEMHTSTWKIKPSETVLIEMIEMTEGWSSKEIHELCRKAFLAAIHRQFISNRKENSSDFRINSESLETVEVLQEDWDTSKSGIQKGKSRNSASATTTKSCSAISGVSNEENISPEEIDKNLGFDSVGGLDEQIKNVRENILFPLLNKTALLEWGVEPVKGIIFHGPPGTGKTLLAKALAAELSQHTEQSFSFFYQKGTDSLQKYIGWTESYLKCLFAKAAACKPAIIFFDEVDGLFSTRKEESSKFYNGIVTTLLGLMDSAKRGEIFVIAATNRIDSVDPALIRPGRFDKSIPFYPPKEDGRKEILEIHSSKWKRGHSGEILAEVAKQTNGFTGADLEQLCRQTFICALRRQFPNISHEDDYKISNDGFDTFDILLQDWYSALTTVKGSNSNAFGNSISIGKAIPPGVSRLISGMEKEIIDKLQVFLKPSTRIAGEEKGAGIKSFLIWDSGVRQARIIENYIIPSLIASSELKETIAFTLNEETIKSSSTFKAFMTQVFNCPKTAILYIPRIEELAKKMVLGGSQNLFMEQIDLLRGEDVLLIASAGCSTSELHEDFRQIFKGMADTRSYKLRKFEIQECREFFSPIFQDKYALLLKRVERLTHGGNFYDILDLKSELNQACVVAKEKNLNEVEEAKVLKEILDSYETNRLDHSGPRNTMYL